MGTYPASEFQDDDRPTGIELLMMGVLSCVMAFVFVGVLSMLLMPRIMLLFM